MTQFEDDLRNRLNRYKRLDGTLPISIKVRVTSGCFCPNCCPAGNRIIDQAVKKYYRKHNNGVGRRGRNLHYEHHESGPELITYLALTAAGLSFSAAALTLGKSVIELLTAIIKARSEGQRQGDRRHEPMDLLVRGFDPSGKMFDQPVLHIRAGDEPTQKLIAQVLKEGLEKAFQDSKKAANPPIKSPKAKRLRKKKVSKRPKKGRRK
jgi:hypothetical protein